MTMKKRDFITLLGGAVVTWPLGVQAQQPTKLPTIGFLGASTASTLSLRTAAFTQRLRELGWIEGRTVAIDYRWAETRPERMGEIAEEFVWLKVDVVVTSAGVAASAAKRATSIIPIVFTVAGDPVGTGLVASLARPGGNVTGLSVQGLDLASKRLGILLEVVPGLRRVAVMANGSATVAMSEMREAQAGAGTLGLEVVAAEIRREEDIAPAIEALKGGSQALYVCADPLVAKLRRPINTGALGARLPTIFSEAENVEDGGLISYGPDVPDLYWRAAEYVDKILHGARRVTFPSSSRPNSISPST
jgi:putative ABC transport system substrate-binding protein